MHIAYLLVGERLTDLKTRLYESIVHVDRLIVTVSCEFRGAVAAHRAAVTRDSSEAVDRKLVCVAHCNTADTRHSDSLHHHDAMTS